MHAMYTVCCIYKGIQWWLRGDYNHLLVLIMWQTGVNTKINAGHDQQLSEHTVHHSFVRSCMLNPVHHNIQIFNVDG